MGKRTITVLAVLALIVAAIQATPAAMLSKDAGDFVWGLAAGLSIGAIVSWVAAKDA